MTITQFLDNKDRENDRFFISKKPGIDICSLKKNEQRLNIQLPQDLVDFYLTTNGLEGDDLIFNIIPLEDVVKDIDNNGEYLEFAEYLIYSEICGLEINSTDENKYRFFTWLTDYGKVESAKRKYIAESIIEFINLYLNGGIFGIWGD